MSETPELITHAPWDTEAAVAPVTPAPVNERAAPIIIENPSALTRRTAIGSPDAPVYGANVHNGPVTAEVAASTEVATPQETALGSQVVAAAAVENLADQVPQGPEAPQQ